MIECANKEDKKQKIQSDEPHGLYPANLYMEDLAFLNDEQWVTLNLELFQFIKDFEETTLPSYPPQIGFLKIL